MKEKNIILSSKNWSQLNDQLSQLTLYDQTVLGGSTFALFVKYYLETSPIYKSKLKNVWLLDEVGDVIKKKLNLPRRDEGIDLIAETNDNKYWAIQAKYRSDNNSTLTVSGKGSLASFNNLAFGHCKNIHFGLVATTVNKPPKKSYLLNKNIGYLTQDTWLAIDDNFNNQWGYIIDKAKNNSIKYIKEEPKPHQVNAIEDCIQHFKKEDKGKIFMPCGTGKTLVSSIIARKINAKSVLIVVPSLNLISQMLKHWTKEYSSDNIPSEWLIVCSDQTIADDRNNDTFKGFIYELGIPTTTNVNEVKEFLELESKKIKIIFVTYQSSRIIFLANRLTNFKFDLAIFDEAHKTVGHKNKAKATLLQDINIKIGKRLYMTATERVFRKNDDTYISMDNENIYGKTIHSLSYKEAIQQKNPIISDYKIITFEITDKEIEESVNSNQFIEIKKYINNLTAREFAAALGLRKAIKELKIKNAISFHRSIKRAKNFKTQQDLISKVYSEYKDLNTFHISGEMKISERINQILSFTKNHGLITNSRCLTEGVDIPAIDCVCFVDPKRSKIDIVQAAGRAMRLSKGKKFGYILVPIFTSNQSITTKNIKDSGFEEVINVIGHLSTNDSRISENLRAIQEGKIPDSGSPIDEILSINVLKEIDKKSFQKAIQLKIWDSIAKFNYRSFEKSRKFARNLKLQSLLEWKNFVAKNRYNADIFPPDIPRDPYQVYKNEYKGISDFLGFFSREDQAIEFVSYEDAKKWATSGSRKLLIRNQKEWIEFVKKNYHDTDKFPINIPIRPSTTYRKNGWTNFGDFLNYKVVKGHLYKSQFFYSYEEAKKWIKNLDTKFISINEWLNYVATNKLPQTIPKFPQSVYKDKGWIGPSDYFGYKIDRKKRLTENDAATYEEAKKFVHSLGFQKEYDWKKNISKNQINLVIPNNIPTNPQIFYKKRGWLGWADFLGNKFEPTSQRNKFEPVDAVTFEIAKKFAATFNFQFSHQWKKLVREHYDSDLFPRKIPPNPEMFYKNKGWLGWADFLNRQN